VAHYRMVVGGVLVGAQRWSIGLSLDGNTVPPDPVAMNVAAVQMFNDFNTAAWSASGTGLTPLKNLASAQATLDSVRLYYYPTGATQATLVGASTQAPVVGSGGISNPPQCALVVSLLTGFAGRKNRGRMYLPCLSDDVTAVGQLSTGRAQLVATTVANWLSLVRTRSVTTGGNSIPIVYSETAGNSAIASVRVDSLIDTQRRRRDKLTPTQTGAANLVVG